MPRISKIYILPPFGIARLGASETPVDAFDWVEDPSTHGGSATVIWPAVSLRVWTDGSVHPYMPPAIFFRDGPGRKIRPTAPFFELWASFDGSADIAPLTATQLKAAGGSLDRLWWRVQAANLKAARRCKDPACGFAANVSFGGDDHARHRLLASSPNFPGARPLVLPSAPIPLGWVQAMLPRRGRQLGVNLDVIRFRFTPAAGEVYGPPTATAAPDPAAPRGDRREFEIVPPQNRILNPDSKWQKFHLNDIEEQPEPADTFDGAIELGNNSLGGRSLGVVDDTCDLTIEATLEFGPVRLTAMARASAGPPDFAPDRRPFMSLADDLADRELPALTRGEVADPETIAEVSDLLQRVRETVGLINLDALREWSLTGQVRRGRDPVPKTSDASMTAADTPLAEQVPDVLQGGAPDERLPLAQTAHDVHGDLGNIDVMLDRFRTQADRLRHLLRPPFARIAELPARAPTALPTDPMGKPRRAVLRPRKRDPRVGRDQLHDMRMPPYMRDSDAAALSLTWRQYGEVMALIDYVSKLDEAAFAKLSPVRQHVAKVAKRRRKAEREQGARKAKPA